MVIMFNTTFYNEEYLIVENRTTIAVEYFKGWFGIDALAIIPFEYIMNDSGSAEDGTIDEDAGRSGASINKLARVTRVARITKIVKLTRLLRVAKIIKERNKLLRYMNDSLKIGHGFDRLMFFGLVFVILIHCFACIMVVFGELFYLEGDNESWLTPY